MRAKANPDEKTLKSRESDRKRHAANPHKVQAAAKAWKAANSDRWRAYQRSWHAANSEKKKAATLKKKYGLSVLDISGMERSQEGRCAICGTDSPGGRWGKFHVDHDHLTGKVRGLLCWGCNALLGLARDCRETLVKAAEYLA